MTSRGLGVPETPQSGTQGERVAALLTRPRTHQPARPSQTPLLGPDSRVSSPEPGLPEPATIEAQPETLRLVKIANVNSPGRRRFISLKPTSRPRDLAGGCSRCRFTVFRFPLAV
jgi:hypothetical protein